MLCSALMKEEIHNYYQVFHAPVWLHFRLHSFEKCFRPFVSCVVLEVQEWEHHFSRPYIFNSWYIRIFICWRSWNIFSPVRNFYIKKFGWRRRDLSWTTKRFQEQCFSSSTYQLLLPGYIIEKLLEDYMVCHWCLKNSSRSLFGKHLMVINVRNLCKTFCSMSILMISVR